MLMNRVQLMYHFSKIKLKHIKDEWKLNYDTCKKRILNLLDENMRNFKKDSLNKQNRMNKLIVDIDIPR